MFFVMNENVNIAKTPDADEEVKSIENKSFRQSLHISNESKKNSMTNSESQFFPKSKNLNSFMGFRL